MTVSTIESIHWGLVFIGWIFHISVAYFVLRMRYIKGNNKNYKNYSPTFFLLYLIISAADITILLITFLTAKIVLIDSWKPWFFAHPEWCTYLWACSGFCIYFQATMHAAIAVNRAWMAFKVTNKNSRMAKFGQRIVWFLPIIPALIVIVRFTGNCVYFYTPDQELGPRYTTTLLSMYHAIAGPTTVIFSSLFTFILAVITILRYRFVFQKFKIQQVACLKTDIMLFCQAFVNLFFQLGLTSYYVITIIAVTAGISSLQVFAIAYYNYMCDASSLCNPIALLIVCSSIRRDYANFYFSKKQRFVSVVATVTLR